MLYCCLSNCFTVRIVLLGKCELDNGHVGNLILGRQAFQTEAFDVSTECLGERVKGQVDERPITVINTPDLFDLKLTPDELTHAVGECMSLSSPGPHVFILILQPGNFSEEDRNKAKAILNLFSDEAINYTIVLTTVRHARHISSFIEGENPLNLIIKECKMRYHIFETMKFHKNQVVKLLENIDQMVAENKGYLNITVSSLFPEDKMKRKGDSDAHKEQGRKKKGGKTTYDL